ncbi:MAG: alpha/beta hydrolase, partial [Candidatus Tumulicola sp.]
MSHTITVPINENGIIFDPAMNGVVAEAIADQPFAFEDVYVYSHGWSTDAYLALDEYNRFSIDLARQILLASAVHPSPLVDPPRNSLGIGIHWPSEITEDPSNDLNALQLFTFYTMEHRADAVGKNALYAMLRLILSNRSASPLPLRLFLLGHSFGSKVICSALNDVQADIASRSFAAPPSVSYRVVLLEPATDDDNLEPGDIYGNVCSIANLRMLVSTSRLDKALNVWYPAAGRLAN